MRRFYFDLRDGESLAPDETGMEMPDVETARQEATLVLARMAEEAVPIVLRLGEHRMAIEIRDDSGPLLKVFLVFTTDRREPQH